MSEYVQHQNQILNTDILREAVIIAINLASGEHYVLVDSNGKPIIITVYYYHPSLKDTETEDEILNNLEKLLIQKGTFKRDNHLKIETKEELSDGIGYKYTFKILDDQHFKSLITGNMDFMGQLRYFIDNFKENNTHGRITIIPRLNNQLVVDGQPIVFNQELILGENFDDVINDIEIIIDALLNDDGIGSNNFKLVKEFNNVNGIIAIKIRWCAKK
jgi:hypothetical protein